MPIHKMHIHDELVFLKYPYGLLNAYNIIRALIIYYNVLISMFFFFHFIVRVYGKKRTPAS